MTHGFRNRLSAMRCNPGPVLSTCIRATLLLLYVPPLPAEKPHSVVGLALYTVVDIAPHGINLVGDGGWQGTAIAPNMRYDMQICNCTSPDKEGHA